MYQKVRYWELKREALQLYGGRCVCCGEANPGFLTFDHVNGITSEWQYPRGRRKGGRELFRRLINNHAPDIQVLCYNCNCGRFRNDGVCPHKTDS